MTGPTWLFGYGSLIWKQDFPFLDARRAHIKGWKRRFWQGSHDHRGTAEAPGRVVTLIETPGEPCYGRAFLIDPDVFEHLDNREVNGYERHPVEIHFDDGQATGIVYVGPVGNFAWLGDAPADEIAAQILRSAGRSGKNLDYVLGLAKALRELDVHDDHVFDLEQRVTKSRSAPLA